MHHPWEICSEICHHDFEGVPEGAQRYSDVSYESLVQLTQ